MDKDKLINNIMRSIQMESKNTEKIEIMLRKEEFEHYLDEMWEIYGTGNVSQYGKYKKGLDMIKNAGLRVFRNSAGKHKITE